MYPEPKIYSKEEQIVWGLVFTAVCQVCQTLIESLIASGKTPEEASRAAIRFVLPMLSSAEFDTEQALMDDVRSKLRYLWLATDQTDKLFSSVLAEEGWVDPASFYSVELTTEGKYRVRPYSFVM